VVPTQQTANEFAEMKQMMEEIGRGVKFINLALPKVEHKVFTPSCVSDSGVRDQWDDFLANIPLEVKLMNTPLINLTKYVQFDRNTLPRNWNEEKVLEEEGCRPLANYLSKLGLSVAIVEKGQHLSSGLLYDVDVYSLRKQDPFIRNQQVVLMGKIRGRTDLVVLHEPMKTVIRRQHVKFAIELKRPSDFSTPASQDIGHRETVCQLLGMNVINNVTSPLAILTNLVEVHFVNQLVRLSKDGEPLRFEVQRRKFTSLAQAVQYADEAYEHDPYRIHFGRRRSEPDA